MLLHPESGYPRVLTAVQVPFQFVQYSMCREILRRKWKSFIAAKNPFTFFSEKNIYILREAYCFLNQEEPISLTIDVREPKSSLCLPTSELYQKSALSAEPRGSQQSKIKRSTKVSHLRIARLREYCPFAALSVRHVMCFVEFGNSPPTVQRARLYFLINSSRCRKLPTKKRARIDRSRKG